MDSIKLRVLSKNIEHLQAESPSGRFSITHERDYEQFKIRVGDQTLSVCEDEIGDSYADRYRYPTKRGELSIWCNNATCCWVFTFSVCKTPLVCAFHVAMQRGHVLTQVLPLRLLAFVLSLISNPYLAWFTITSNLRTPRYALTNLLAGCREFRRHYLPLATQGVGITCTMPVLKDGIPRVLSITRGKPELAERWDWQIPTKFFLGPQARIVDSPDVIPIEMQCLEDVKPYTFKSFLKTIFFSLFVTAMWWMLVVLCFTPLMPLAVPFTFIHTFVVLLAWGSIPLGFARLLSSKSRR